MGATEKKRSQPTNQTPRIVQIEKNRQCMVATSTDGSVVPLMSRREIGDYLGVGRTILRDLIKSGAIPSIMVGGHLKFDVLAVRAALDRKR